jgi:propane monooxygenase reductase component
MAAAPREGRAQVSAVRALTADVLEADLVMIEPAALTFEAGQWISVPFGPKQVRAYSIASSPRTPSQLTLCADIAPDGIGSHWFRALVPGAEVVFKGPLGGFVLPPSEERAPLFVGEEIGIVPIRAIIKELAEQRRARLIYGGAAQRRPYEAEFRERAHRDPAFSYDAVNGALTDAVERLVTDVTGVVAYVAGGETTIKRVRDILVRRGLDRKSVKWERFW